MNADEFRDSIVGLRRNLLLKCEIFLSELVSEQIKDFSPIKDAYRLQDFLSAFYAECEDLESDFDKDELYISIQNLFLLIISYLIFYTLS